MKIKEMNWKTIIQYAFWISIMLLYSVGFAFQLAVQEAKLMPLIVKHLVPIMIVVVLHALNRRFQLIKIAIKYIQEVKLLSIYIVYAVIAFFAMVEEPYWMDTYFAIISVFTICACAYSFGTHTELTFGSIVSSSVVLMISGIFLGASLATVLMITVSGTILLISMMDFNIYFWDKHLILKVFMAGMIFCAMFFIISKSYILTEKIVDASDRYFYSAYITGKYCKAVISGTPAALKITSEIANRHILAFITDKFGAGIGILITMLFVIILISAFIQTRKSMQLTRFFSVGAFSIIWIQAFFYYSYFWADYSIAPVLAPFLHSNDLVLNTAWIGMAFIIMPPQYNFSFSILTRFHKVKRKIERYVLRKHLEKDPYNTDDWMRLLEDYADIMSEKEYEEIIQELQDIFEPEMRRLLFCDCIEDLDSDEREMLNKIPKTSEGALTLCSYLEHNIHCTYGFNLLFDDFAGIMTNDIRIKMIDHLRAAFDVGYLKWEYPSVFGYPELGKDSECMYIDEEIECDEIT